MNDLLYQVRMALKDVMEVKIFTPGGAGVYLRFLPHLFWEGSTSAQKDQAVTRIVDSIRDMGLDLANGNDDVAALRRCDDVEVVRRSATAKT